MHAYCKKMHTARKKWCHPKICPLKDECISLGNISTHSESRCCCPIAQNFLIFLSLNFLLFLLHGNTSSQLEQHTEKTVLCVLWSRGQERITDYTHPSLSLLEVQLGALDSSASQWKLAPRKALAGNQAVWVRQSTTDCCASLNGASNWNPFWCIDGKYIYTFQEIKTKPVTHCGKVTDSIN